MDDVYANRAKLVKAIREYDDKWDFNDRETCAIGIALDLELGYFFWDIISTIGLPQQYSGLFFDLYPYNAEHTSHVTKEMVANALEAAPFET